MNKSSISKWGPSAWNYLHTFTFSYALNPTDENKHQAYEFLKYFGLSIPCHTCRVHYNEYFNKFLVSEESEHLASREAFSKYMVDFHNNVNIRIGKKTYSYESVVKMYTKPCFKNIYRIGVLLVLCLVVFLIPMYMKTVNNKKCTTSHTRTKDTWFRLKPF